jgi:hypothetical protein
MVLRPQHGFARGALDTPNGEPAQLDTDIMRVTRQASATVTARLVGELKAQSQDKGEDKLDKRLAIVKQANVGGFIVEIDGERAVVPRRCSCCAQSVPPDHHGSSGDETRWGEHLEISRPS